MWILIIQSEFSGTFNGIAADWCRSLESGSITSSEMLKDMFIGRFIRSKHIKKALLEIFVMEQCEDESLRQQYAHFLAASVEVEELMRMEKKMAAFAMTSLSKVP